MAGLLVAACAGSEPDGDDPVVGDPTGAPTDPASAPEDVGLTFVGRLNEGRGLVASSAAGVTAVATSTDLVVRHDDGTSTVVPTARSTDVRELVVVRGGDAVGVLGGDGRFELWDLASPEPTLLRSDDDVIAVLDAPDDRLLVTRRASAGRIATADGGVVDAFVAPTGSAISAVSALGDDLLVALDRGPAGVVRSSPDGEAVSVDLGLPTGAVVRRLATSLDGARLLAAALPTGDPFAGEITSWDPSTGRPTWTVDAGTAVEEGTWDLDAAGGLIVASGSTVRVFDEGGRPLGEVALPDGGVRTVVGSATGRGALVVTASASLQRILVTDDGLGVEPAAAGSAARIDVGADRLTLVASDGTVTILDRDGRLVEVIDDYATGSITGVAAGPAGEVAAASTTGTVSIWRAARSSDPVRLIHDEGAVSSVVFSSTGDRVLTGVAQRRAAQSFDDTLSTWDLATGERLHRVGGEAEEVAGCSFFSNILRTSSDGELLVATSHDFSVSLYDADDLRLLHTFPPHGNSILDVVFTSDDARLVTTADDSTLRVWDVETRELLADHVSTTGGYRSLAALPGGTVLAGDLSGRLVELDLATGEERRELEGSKVRDAPLAASPDGRFVASAAEGDVIQVWDVASGRIVADGAEHSGPVGSIAFSPDSAQLVSGSTDGTVVVWSVSP